MGRRITILQGHPDPAGGHLCSALADAYADGARAGGHEVKLLSVAQIRFELVRSKDAWEAEAPAEAIRAAQDALVWADHLFIVYPLWLGDMPAVFKGFLEQVLRPHFAGGKMDPASMTAKTLRGKSARIVVTMGMPALIYRWYFGAYSLRILKRNIFGFLGVRPIRSSIIGTVESTNANRWIEVMRRYGKSAR